MFLVEPALLTAVVPLLTSSLCVDMEPVLWDVSLLVWNANVLHPSTSRCIVRTPKTNSMESQKWNELPAVCCHFRSSVDPWPQCALPVYLDTTWIEWMRGAWNRWPSSFLTRGFLLALSYIWGFTATNRNITSFRSRKSYSYWKDTLWDLTPCDLISHYLMGCGNM